MKQASSISRLTAVLLAGAPLLLAENADAKDIFRWVDSDGAVHFSDTRPAADDVEVTTLTLASSASDYDASLDPYSILNQAARTHERWQAIQSIRLAESRAAQPQSPSPPAPPPATYRRYSRLGYWPGRDDYFYGDPSRLAANQYRALSELDLTGARPDSINSGAHRERVQRSQALPLALPRPMPRNP